MEAALKPGVVEVHSDDFVIVSILVLMEAALKL
jgi:hypothetical protein